MFSFITGKLEWNLFKIKYLLIFVVLGNKSLCQSKHFTIELHDQPLKLNTLKEIE